MNHYPIRTISELTGVSGTTLRAWERRYGLLKPARTPKGHRLYSSDDIDLIKEVVRLMKQGHAIGEVVRILRNPGADEQNSRISEPHWEGYQQRMLKAIANFDEQGLDRAYSELLSLYPVDMVTGQVVIPVLESLGQRWQQREAGIAEEHFFSAFLRNKLGARLHHEAGRSRGSRIVVSCLPGEYHELGVLLFCIAAIGHGYRILYLGANLPPSQLPLVAQRTEVAAILLSGSRAEHWGPQLESALSRCIESIQVPLMLGGECSAAHREQIEGLGIHALGADHARALENMEAIIPAFMQS